MHKLSNRMTAKEINLRIPIKEGDNKYYVILQILGIISPFNSLRPKEKELFAWLLYFNNLYLTISVEDRFTLIMSKKKEISEEMGISVDNFYNIIMNLKKKNLLLDNQINPTYIIGDIDKINFSLKYDVK